MAQKKKQLIAAGKLDKHGRPNESTPQVLAVCGAMATAFEAMRAPVSVHAGQTNWGLHSLLTTTLLVGLTAHCRSTCGRSEMASSPRAQRQQRSRTRRRQQQTSRRWAALFAGPVCLVLHAGRAGKGIPFFEHGVGQQPCTGLCSSNCGCVCGAGVPCRMHHPSLRRRRRRRTSLRRRRRRRSGRQWRMEQTRRERRRRRKRRTKQQTSDTAKRCLVTTPDHHMHAPIWPLICFLLTVIGHGSTSSSLKGGGHNIPSASRGSRKCCTQQPPSH